MAILENFFKKKILSMNTKEFVKSLGELACPRACKMQY